MNITFDGAIAVVTGGASGIGEASARGLAAAGARVAVADLNIERAEAVAADIGGLAVPLDLAQEASIRAMAQRVEAELGPIEVLVNSGGVLQRPLPPEDLTLKEWDIVIRVDLRGLYVASAEIGGAMARRGRGAIVNIASVSGMTSNPVHAYGPAKAAVINLTASLAAEWGGRGVRVNAVSPGFTETPGLRRGMTLKMMDPARMTQNSALGRMVRADEIAAAVTFLASSSASAITGVNLPVDAGFLVAPPWAAYGNP
ncbi:MAG: SDR family oxidoreductase [Phenylobacterium sp.]|nr:SDR family oxidoreductase [Phenylobacterium sp.]